jgi:hypothetical protein
VKRRNVTLPRGLNLELWRLNPELLRVGLRIKEKARIRIRIRTSIKVKNLIWIRI